MQCPNLIIIKTLSRGQFNLKLCKPATYIPQKPPVKVSGTHVFIFQAAIAG